MQWGVQGGAASWPCNRCCVGQGPAAQNYASGAGLEGQPAASNAVC